MTCTQSRHCHLNLEETLKSTMNDYLDLRPAKQTVSSIRNH